MNRSWLSVLLVGSFVLAISGFVSSPWMNFITRSQQSTSVIAWSGKFVGPAWVILALISLLCFGKRALWVLLGLPFALASEAWLVLVMVACSRGTGCL